MALVIKVRYMDLDIEPDGAGTLPIDPLFVDLGVAIRWGSR